MSVERLLLAAGRRKRSRRWLPADIAELEAMVGRLTPLEMAERLGRSLNSVKCKLGDLGFGRKEIRDSLGLSVIDVARRLEVPYEVVWRKVKSGELPARRFERGKDFLVSWTDIRKLGRHFDRIRRRRDRVLARIAEPTISKQAFMKLVGLAETQVTRYMQGGIVRCWKVPCKWSAAGGSQWEWLVSLRDARRVKRERESGQLRLGKKKFRALVDKENARVLELRRAGRLGHSSRTTRVCPIPGRLSPAQVALQAGVSHETVMRNIHDGRLAARRVRVGRREFFGVSKAAAAAYAIWRRTNYERWRKNSRSASVAAINKAGRLTLAQAAECFGVKRARLYKAVYDGRLEHTRAKGIVAVLASDVKRYLQK